MKRSRGRSRETAAPRRAPRRGALTPVQGRRRLAPGRPGGPDGATTAAGVGHPSSAPSSRGRLRRRDRRESRVRASLRARRRRPRLRAVFLAGQLTDGLKPLARVAYNYRWSWTADGAAVFRDINPHRWELSGANPVRFLNDLWPSTQEAVERNPELLERIEALAAAVAADLARADAAAARGRRAGRLLLRRVRLPRRRCRSTRAGSGCSPATSSRRRATRRCR